MASENQGTVHQLVLLSKYCVYSFTTLSSYSSQNVYTIWDLINNFVKRVINNWNSSSSHIAT